MNKKIIGIVVTIISTLLCACPGLVSLGSGALFSLFAIAPGGRTTLICTPDITGRCLSLYRSSGDTQKWLAFSAGGICIGLLFLLIPVLVGYLTLGKQVLTSPGSRKGVGIIATACSTLGCGTTGVGMLLLGGAIAVAGGGWWYITKIESGVRIITQSGSISLLGGAAILCVGTIFALIPVLVGFFTLRKRKPAVPSSFNEPIPPAI